MSYSLYLRDLSPEQIAFGYSAAHETIIALHVFMDCKHHPLHIPWVINARKKVDSALKREMEAFSIFYRRPIVPFWNLRMESSLRPFDADLKDFLHQPVEVYGKTVVETILNRKALNIFNDGELKTELIELVNRRCPDSKEVILDMLNDPLASRQRFINMLESFWHACVKEEWPHIEELFLKDISIRGRKLIQEGPLHLLGSLSKEIDIYPEEKKAMIRRISKEEISFHESDVLYLAPTYFAWPHLFVNYHMPVGINYPIMENQREAAQPIPPEDLLRFFKALGDFTRLQIIKYLAQKPRSTRELAHLLGVTEGAVSKHLKQLGDAGLVASKRESYYVFYYLLERTFNNFPLSLSKFLKSECK
jgi:DNA-binding transcriptional ArsR family regulator